MKAAIGRSSDCAAKPLSVGPIKQYVRVYIHVHARLFFLLMGISLFAGLCAWTCVGGFRFAFFDVRVPS